MSEMPREELLFRELDAGDLPAAHRLSSGFGWPHRIEDWRGMLELGSGIAAVGADGRLAGTAMHWMHSASTATLGMILVDPAMQRRGVGRRLFQELLAEVGDRRLLLYATEAGQDLYAAHGFRGFGRARQYQGQCSGPVPSSRVRPATRFELAGLRDLDTQAFGAPRERLMTKLIDVGTPMVFEAAGRISGFAIRRDFGRGALIGPVIAANEADAVELIAASLVPGFNRVDVANDKPRVTEALARLGMTDASAVVPMVRGDWPAGSTTARRFALASQAFG